MRARDKTIKVVALEVGDVIGAGLGVALDKATGIDLVSANMSLIDLNRATSNEIIDVAIVLEGAITRLRTVVAPPTPVVLLPNPPPYGTRASIGVMWLPLVTSGSSLCAAVHIAATAGPQQSLLTPREQDILACFVCATTHSEIAEQLSISRETVRTHTANIRRKLGVTSSRQLQNIARILV
jgi:DNA-binding CsgD family transcriptional regulator